jgi:hypothetical protein
VLNVMEERTMQYGILIYRDESRDGEFDWPQIEADYEAYFKRATESGILQHGPRFDVSSATRTVKVRDGRRSVTDGPSNDTREQLAGVFVLECRDLDDALDWAAQCPGAAHGVVEVRPLLPGA